MKTGIYIRINRNNEWQPILIENCTDKERKALFNGRNPEELIRWINSLCQSYNTLSHSMYNALTDFHDVLMVITKGKPIQKDKFPEPYKVLNKIELWLKEYQENKNETP
jgi:hypothetical protein